MKIKSFIAVALATAVGLSACSKEENKQQDNGETKTVIINISDGAKTRMGGAPSGTTGTVTFSSGTIYFADNQNVITKTVSTGAITSATANFVIEDVPSQSHKVYVVGNVGGLPVNGKIDQILNYGVLVNTQMGADNDVSVVALYGAEELDKSVSTHYTANVDVNPIAGRIEIAQFTANIPSVTDYKVDGIFVNNYYNKIKLSGVITGDSEDLKVNGTEIDTENPTIYVAPSASYPADVKGYVYDFDKDNGLGVYNNTTKVYRQPKNSNNEDVIWAYNLLAPTGSGTAFPRIIIRFAGITGVQGVKPTEYKYITVKGFKDGSGTTIENFEAGKIYTITNFTFTENDLEIRPEMETVDATVTVSLAEWSRETVNPIH